jgi:hypothetical protein
MSEIGKDIMAMADDKEPSPEARYLQKALKAYTSKKVHNRKDRVDLILLTALALDWPEEEFMQVMGHLNRALLKNNTGIDLEEIMSGIMNNQKKKGPLH